MIKNYLKIAWRNLWKNKVFSAINIIGLALGLAAFLLIALSVLNELSYDRYNAKAARIYRVNDDIKFGGNLISTAVSPPPLASGLEATFPGIEKAVRFRQYGTAHIKKDNDIIEEKNITYCDPGVFEVFTLPMLAGDPSTALKEPNSVVITQSTAIKYFNSTKVLGKIFVFDKVNNYAVTGVIKDIPSQSHFKFDFFVSMPTLAESKDPTWLNTDFQTYVLLTDGADYRKIENKLQQFVNEHIGPQLQGTLHTSFDEFEKKGNYFRLSLMPLTKIHLESNRTNELGQNGNIEYVCIFSAVAFFILLIACVNFINLSTARSSNRAREVGVRKVLGSPRKYLIGQFLAESIILALVAGIVALLTAWIFLPLFNQMSAEELTVSPDFLTWLTPASLILILVIGALSGIYPAFFLSAFRPVDVLKGRIAAGLKGGGLRSFLVIFQFSISVFLIIGTLVVYNQLSYIQHKDLGYNRDHVLVIKNVSALDRQAKTFKQEIKQLTGVVNATLSGYTPTSGNYDSQTIFKSVTLDPKSGLLAQQWMVDEDYISTLAMRLTNGRNFSNQFPTDSSAVIVNETAANLLGYSNPINRQLYRPEDDYGKKIKAYHIIGVIRDFNFNSLRANITPLILKFESDNGALSVRVNSADIPGLLQRIRNKWSAFSPNQPFNYSFMVQDFDALYSSEQRVGKIALSFTLLAIIIACLGLFGLAAYAAEQRMKEICIRKVLGASISTIVRMLAIDFVKLVLVAIIIASPLAWLAMQKWLQGFAYRQNTQWWVLVAAGLGVTLITLITISFQSLKASLANPVKNLRND